MSTMGSTGGAGPSSTGGAASTGESQGSTAGSSSSMSMGSSAGSTAGSGSTMGSTGQGSTYTATAGSTASINFKWNEGWREAIAAGDPKMLARLGRFNSPEDMWRSYTALEARMSSGELKSALPKDATPEQLATWRKENGIPEKPTDYELKFANGTVIGEEDMPVVGKFLEIAHKNNLSNAQVKDTLEWYYTMAEAQTEEQATKDTTIAREAQDKLRAKWGTEYRPNINSVHGLLDGAPAGLKDLILNGRLANGTPIGSSVEALEWLAGMSRQLNPVGTVVPAGTLNPGQHIAGELEKLTAMMGNRNSPYWKGDKAKEHQARYRELVEANNRMQQQAGGKK